MSKKLEAIKKAVFYAHEKPEVLASMLDGIIPSVATSIIIEGASSIKIPAEGNTTSVYSAEGLDQFGDKLSANPTLALDTAVSGVSISDGTVTVASTCVADSFTLKATSDSLSATKVVSLTTD